MSDSAVSRLKSPKAIALIVLTIVAVALVGYNLVGMLSDPSKEPSDPITETRRSMGEIPGRVAKALTDGAPVTTLDALPPMEGWKNASVDEWKNPFVFEAAKQPRGNNWLVTARSNGADGLPNTEDDIVMTGVIEYIPEYKEYVAGLTEFDGARFESGGE